MPQTPNSEEQLRLMEDKLKEKELELYRSRHLLDLLEETSKAITSEIQLEKLVQRVTDYATKLSGAQFGAFFYNVEDSDKKLLLYTISGVPKSLFDAFPVPRMTTIFRPTFEGTRIVRYDDVTKEPLFGRNTPFNGMPAGHLPVRSYLAVPVVSPLNHRVLGGLLFGHEEPGVFTEKEESIVKGIALQGAIAMGNARLFEEKRKAEETAREQNRLISTLTNNTSLGLFLLNAEGICTYMNPAAEKMTGLLLNEVATLPLFNYFSPHANPDLELNNLLAIQAKIQGEAIFLNKAGVASPVFFTASPIIENNKLSLIVLEVRDTSEEKRILGALREKDILAKEQLEILVKERTSELEKINDELLQFTSIASHDLKEPVRKISIFSHMLKERLQQVTSENNTRLLDTIIKSSKRMTALIDDLLSFTRLSQSEFNFTTVDLNAVIASVLEDFELLIEEKQAKFFIDHLPPVEGVSLQLGQVFQNLVSNSLKFSDPSRPLEIRIRYEKIDDASFRIIYSDTGIGFDRQFSERIFNLFQRLHTKESYEGTGIGLSIVKKIISLHKGSVSADGTEGVGATFSIVMPYKQKNHVKTDSFIMAQRL